MAVKAGKLSGYVRNQVPPPGDALPAHPFTFDLTSMNAPPANINVVLSGVRTKGSAVTPLAFKWSIAIPGESIVMLYVSLWDVAGNAYNVNDVGNWKDYEVKLSWVAVS